MLRIITLLKKATTIINNLPRNSHSGPIFKKSNILKFEDKIPMFREVQYCSARASLKCDQ